MRVAIGSSDRQRLVFVETRAGPEDLREDEDDQSTDERKHVDIGPCAAIEQGTRSRDGPACRDAET